MPKQDPKGEVPNPIRAKLAGEISRPFHVVQASGTSEAPKPPPVLTEALPALVSEPATQPPPSTKLAKPKKVLFTVAEQRENDAVIRQLGEAIGAPTLGWSHVNRALWCLLRRSQDLIDERRSDAPHLVRPSNGNPIELARFEDTLAQYLLTVFKDVPLRPFN